MTTVLDPMMDEALTPVASWSWDDCGGGADDVARTLRFAHNACVRAALLPHCAGQTDHAPWCEPATKETIEAGLVEVIAEAERLKHALAALQARATEELRAMREAAAGDDRKAAAEAVRSVASEVALARRESPWWGDRRVALARVLPTEMPKTWALFQQGEVTERVAHDLLAQTSCLSRDDRLTVDTRLAESLPTLTAKQVAARARRIAAELDAASVVARMSAAVKCRRVSVRPAPDGMAFLSVLGPLHEVVAAYAALTRHAAQTCAGLTATDPEGRTPGQVAADTALELLSGRAAGQPLPVEIQLVMTDRALLGTGDQERSTDQPAWLPGYGMLPTPAARAWIADPAAKVWLRRLYTSPKTGDLVAMDTRSRCFTGGLRDMVLLRDDLTCSTPWCGAPARHVDHTIRDSEGGETSYENGAGLCERCNYTREAPGWTVIPDPTGPPGTRITHTPAGQMYRHEPEPLLL